jgi:DNA segregation ATPase FtsK/SpoIIIE, S-DNA-T family
VNVADLPPRLRKLAPSWGAYRQLTGVQLRRLLEVEGVRVYTTGGTLRVDPADLEAAATRPTDATSAGQWPAEPIDD